MQSTKIASRLIETLKTFKDAFTEFVKKIYNEAYKDQQKHGQNKGILFVCLYKIDYQNGKEEKLYKVIRVYSIQNLGKEIEQFLDEKNALKVDDITDILNPAKSGIDYEHVFVIEEDTHKMISDILALLSKKAKVHNLIVHLEANIHPYCPTNLLCMHLDCHDECCNEVDVAANSASNLQLGMPPVSLPSQQSTPEPESNKEKEMVTLSQKDTSDKKSTYYVISDDNLNKIQNVQFLPLTEVSIDTDTAALIKYFTGIDLEKGGYVSSEVIKRLLECQKVTEEIRQYVSRTFSSSVTETATKHFLELIESAAREIALTAQTNPEYKSLSDAINAMIDNKYVLNMALRHFLSYQNKEPQEQKGQLISYAGRLFDTQDRRFLYTNIFVLLLRDIYRDFKDRKFMSVSTVQAIEEAIKGKEGKEALRFMIDVFIDSIKQYTEDEEKNKLNLKVGTNIITDCAYFDDKSICEVINNVRFDKPDVSLDCQNMNALSNAFREVLYETRAILLEKLAVSALQINYEEYRKTTNYALDIIYNNMKKRNVSIVTYCEEENKIDSFITGYIISSYDKNKKYYIITYDPERFEMAGRLKNVTVTVSLAKEELLQSISSISNAPDNDDRTVEVIIHDDFAKLVDEPNLYYNVKYNVWYSYYFHKVFELFKDMASSKSDDIKKYVRFHIFANKYAIYNNTERFITYIYFISFLSEQSLIQKINNYFNFDIEALFIKVGKLLSVASSDLKIYSKGTRPVFVDVEPLISFMHKTGMKEASECLYDIGVIRKRAMKLLDIIAQTSSLSQFIKSSTIDLCVYSGDNSLEDKVSSSHVEVIPLTSESEIYNVMNAIQANAHSYLVDVVSRYTGEEAASQSGTSSKSYKIKRLTEYRSLLQEFDYEFVGEMLSISDITALNKLNVTYSQLHASVGLAILLRNQITEVKKIVFDCLKILNELLDVEATNSIFSDLYPNGRKEALPVWSSLLNMARMIPETRGAERSAAMVLMVSSFILENIETSFLSAQSEDEKIKVIESLYALLTRELTVFAQNALSEYYVNAIVEAVDVFMRHAACNAYKNADEVKKVVDVNVIKNSYMFMCHDDVIGKALALTLAIILKYTGTDQAKEGYKELDDLFANIRTPLLPKLLPSKNIKDIWRGIIGSKKEKVSYSELENGFMTDILNTINVFLEKGLSILPYEIHKKIDVNFLPVMHHLSGLVVFISLVMVLRFALEYHKKEVNQWLNTLLYDYEQILEAAHIVVAAGDLNYGFGIRTEHKPVLKKPSFRAKTDASEKLKNTIMKYEANVVKTIREIFGRGKHIIYVSVNKDHTSLPLDDYVALIVVSGSDEQQTLNKVTAFKESYKHIDVFWIISDYEANTLGLYRPVEFSKSFFYNQYRDIGKYSANIINQYAYNYAISQKVQEEAKRQLNTPISLYMTII